MKSRLILLVLFTGCILSSCRKERFICSYNIYYSYTTLVAFKGFTTADLDTVLVERYEGGKYPAGKIRVDTVIATSPYFEGDTAYLSPGFIGSLDPAGFAEIAANVDFHIILSNGSEFMITGATTGPSSYTWEQKEPCSPGSGSARISTFRNIRVDGNEVLPVARRSNPWYIYLERH